MHTTEKYCTRHQLLLVELAIASVSHNVLFTKSVSAITFYTEQTLPQWTRIRKPKFTTVFVKRHSNYDTQITRDHSATETTSQILSYLINFEK